jgi:hypothetical protein
VREGLADPRLVPWATLLRPLRGLTCSANFQLRTLVDNAARSKDIIQDPFVSPRACETGGGRDRSPILRFWGFAYPGSQRRRSFLRRLAVKSRPLALIKPLSRRYYLTREFAQRDAAGSSPFVARPDDVNNMAGYGIRLLEIENVLAAYPARSLAAEVATVRRLCGEALHFSWRGG